MSKIEEKIVFGLAPATSGEGPLIILGIPEAAWEYMKDGKTHTFDFTRVGWPIQMILYGAKDHDAAMKMIDSKIAARGSTSLDLRREDFSLKGDGK